MSASQAAMDEDFDKNLAPDGFDDQSIQDAPVGESFYYSEDEYIEDEEKVEEVVPTSENHENRYKPNLQTQKELSRIQKEHPSVLSEKSNISNQFGFQNAGKAIDQYTDRFFSDSNRAERWFPEADLVNKGISPARDKHNL